MKKILVIGACGQLGTELTLKLRDLFGIENVVASDLRVAVDLIKDGPYEQLDVMDKSRLDEVISTHNIDQIYHLAAILSARGEQNPMLAWDLNMTSLLNVLETGRDRISKIYSCKRHYFKGSFLLNAHFGKDQSQLAKGVLYFSRFFQVVS